MGQEITVTGIILSSGPVRDYDKRIVMLTKERGRISIFATGARKVNSPLHGMCEPFSFGQFTLYEGRNSYSLQGGKVENYFHKLKQDLELIYYGSYFCEFASYLTRENNDEILIMKLLYQSLRALELGTIPVSLIRSIFEIKILAFHGYAMESFQCIRCGKKEDLTCFQSEAGGVLCSECGKKEKSMVLAESTLYTIQYIMSMPIEKLYTFRVSAPVMRQLKDICKAFMDIYVEYSFKSLEFIDLKY